MAWPRFVKLKAPRERGEQGEAHRDFNQGRTRLGDGCPRGESDGGTRRSRWRLQWLPRRLAIAKKRAGRQQGCARGHGTLLKRPGRRAMRPRREECAWDGCGMGRLDRRYGCRRRGMALTGGAGLAAAESGAEARGNGCLAELGRRFAGPREPGCGRLRAQGRRGAGPTAAREMACGPKVRKRWREKKKFFFFLFLEFFKSIFQMDLNSCFQIWSNQSSQE